MWIKKILEFKQYRKSDEKQSMIYVDQKHFTKKICCCKNNLKKSLTTKVGWYIPSGFSMSTIGSFDGVESKHKT